MKNLLSLLFALPFILTAQTKEVDTLKLKASLGLTGFWQGGNVQTLIFRAKSETRYRPWENWTFTNQNSYVYQAFGKAKADEDILSLNFLTYNSDAKLYPVVLGIISTNFRREIDLRYLFGGGITYQLIDKKDKSLKFSLTSEYEQTEFKRADYNIEAYDGIADINTFRSTLWIKGKYQFFEKKFIVTHESFFQPSLEHSNNYRWQADVGFEVPLSKYFNFKINYVSTFESVVIQGQKQSDSFMSFGLNIKNY